MERCGMPARSICATGPDAPGTRLMRVQTSPSRRATRPRSLREAADSNKRQGPSVMTRETGLISMRGLAAFTTGALAAVIASRVLPPLLAQAAGSAQAAAGWDPFDTLADDHRIILSLLDRMESSPDNAVFDG